MESNVTMFEETIYNVTYPLYATYMKLFGLLPIHILVVISSSYVICVILKNNKLRNTNNMLIINLLITDIICTVTHCCIVLPLMIAYLAGMDFDYNCDVMTPFISWILMSTRMMILPPAAHRFICVARPFTHKLIMTKRRIILMIVALWAIPLIASIAVGRDTSTVYVPSFGTCATVNDGLVLGPFLTLIGYISSFVLTVISAVYLRHKIIHVKERIYDLRQCGMGRRKLNKSQRLKKLLTAQIKPTIAVFIAGGIDGVCNLLIGTIILFVEAFSMPIMRFQVYQAVMIPLFFLQSLSHSLSYGLYNKKIRDETCYPKRS